MKKTKRRDNESTTAIRIDSDTFRNFRTICLTQDKNASLVIEDILDEYVKTHACKASEYLKNVAKGLADA